MNLSSLNNVSFGMAKVSKKGAENAKNVLDIKTNYYNDSKLYENPSFSITTPALLSYINKTGDAGREKAQKTILRHGNSNCADKNAAFITGQLLKPKTQDYIKSLARQGSSPADRKYYNELIDTEEAILFRNWDNPKLSLKDTRKLLDAVAPKYSAKEYAMWQGILDQASVKEIKSGK